MKGKVWRIFIIFSAMLLIAGCAAKKMLDLKMKKIVVVLSGSRDDMSWNMSNIEGIRACNKSKKVNIEYIEHVVENDYEKTFSEYAMSGYDIIIGAGSQFNDAIEAIAPKYKATLFCIINGTVTNVDNVVSVRVKEYEVAYIASIIAGRETKNGVFATIGGYPNVPMKKMLDVYEANAVRLAKERGIDTAHSMRAYANSWDDVKLGYDITEQMLEDGADTVLVYANKVCIGCINALKGKNAHMIGLATDQSRINSGVVIASVIFDFEKLYTWVLDEYAAGRLPGKRQYAIGMNQDMFCLSYTDQISEDTVDAVNAALRDLRSGKIRLNEE